MKKLAMLLMLLLVITMGSHRVFAQTVTVALMPGWNWISCPTTDTLDFATAFGSFTPMQDDIIKSRWGAANYRNGQWKGNISQFFPGYGYHYLSNRTMPVMVTFNAQQPAPQVIVTTAEPTDITTNSATCGGNVISSSGDYVSVILRGICWSTDPNPTFSDNYIEVENGLGSFSTSAIGLTYNTTYYVRAFAVTDRGTYYGNEVSFITLDIPTGAINGLFSVSESQQVYFSQGNLQYQAFSDTWRFAENQYDYVGDANSNISSTYSGWIDLFGWGTSGYHNPNDQHNVNYHPWSNATYAYGSSLNYYGYGPSINMPSPSLTGSSANYDWGVYNPIINGGNINNQWHTLTYEEWNYVLFNRSTVSGIRYAKAKVANVNGIILLPDNWSNSIYNLNSTNSSDAGYGSNTLTESQWISLENAGAVFLPAAGYRLGTSASIVGSYGYYWSATYGSYTSSCYVLFKDDFLDTNDNWDRCFGFSVRLVRDAEQPDSDQSAKPQ